MINFCTLFDSNYLTKGLAMYESLKQHSTEFHLFIFTFNDTAFDILSKLKLDFVTLVTMEEFEDNQLLAVKKERTIAEYCWTCTSSVILYCLQKFNLDSCTYLDADLYFYSSPEVLIKELDNKSVLITEHRYSAKNKYLEELAGKYCVQFITFKNNEYGLNVLKWWRNKCLDWCFARYEDGKFGDQKYLDNWTEQFVDVYSLQNIGGGLAPWNIDNYTYFKENNYVYIYSVNDNRTDRLCFYHFHFLKFMNDKSIYLGQYKINRFVKKNLYYPYINHLIKIQKKIFKTDFIKINPSFFNYIKRTVKLTFYPSHYVINKFNESN